MKKSSKLLLFAFALLFGFRLYAQNDATFSDKVPTYTLSENYQKQRMVTQVIYTETATIVHHSYTAEYGGGVYYLGVPHHEERWVLQNKANPKEVFPLTEVRNIRKNGVLLKASLKNEMSVYYEGNPNDVFTCEVHFPRLPKHVKVVNLLEGVTLSGEGHRFHAFNLQLKPRPEPVVVAVKTPEIPKVTVVVPTTVETKKPVVVETLLSDALVTVYPNPAQDKIFVALDKDQPFSIDIIDGLGRTVIKNANAEISVKDWQRGTYFVKITGKKDTFTKKIVLE